MTNDVAMPTEFDPETNDPEDWIRENRDMIEREANSDAPDAWVFQRFLASLKGSEHSRGSATTSDECTDKSYCPDCGEGVGKDDAFCRHCGDELPESDV